jgi:hypothetical protein
MTDPAVPDSEQRSLAASLAITLADHVKEFLRAVAQSPQNSLRSTKRLRATVGYSIKLTYTTPDKVSVSARCSNPLALGLLVDYLRREHDATVEAVSKYLLHAVIILGETAPSEPKA